MKKILCKTLTLFIMCTLLPISSLAAIDFDLIQKNMEKWYLVQFDKGAGTRENPYIIDEAEDLEFMADTVFRNDYTYKGKYFRLSGDLYLNDIKKPIKEWKTSFPIGWDDRAFEGHFDGGGHTIYGYRALVVDYNDCKALFGRVNNGSITNLTMSDTYFSSGISDGFHTAVLVNNLSAVGGTATIENCHSRNPRGNITRLVTTAYATDGGKLTIKNCTVSDATERMIGDLVCENDSAITISGLVRSPKMVKDENGVETPETSKEGLIHVLRAGTESKNEGRILIENCINNCPVYYAPGVIASSSVDRGNYSLLSAGGIVGTSFRKKGDDIIRNCKNTAFVFGFGGVGGIAGFFTSGTIENCINTGDIYVTEARAGGIVGQHTAGNITGCVNRGSVNVVDTEILIGVTRFGGIAGVNNGVIEGCINYGEFSGSPMGSPSLETGGIVGRGSYIYNCANHGKLLGAMSVSGGIAGTVGLNVPEAVVENCYNAAGLTASPNNSGSVIGVSKVPTGNCYYLFGSFPCGRYTDASEEGFDLPDYKVLSHEEMLKPESFEGFDFTEKWIMPSENGYPVPREAHHGDVAIPRETEIDINGKIVKLFGYNINGNNYYKLRDIAFLLLGTKSNFAVDWNAEEGIIEISLKTPYTPIGSENEVGGRMDRAVNLKEEKALLGGKSIGLRAYKIDGSNYFTIREVAEIIGFRVDWNEKERRIIVNA